MMIEQKLSQYTGIPQSKIARLLQLSRDGIYEDAEYAALLKSLDVEHLYDTLPQARAAYEKFLPYFADILHKKYEMIDTPMSAFTLGNWLVGFLHYPESIRALTKMHQRLPVDAIRTMLPDMIAMLDSMGDGRAEWQRALALMALPLIIP